MRIFVTGASGLIGRHLIRRLGARGDAPVLLSRRADALRNDPEFRGFRIVQGDPAERGEWESAVDGCDAVVNLAGHNLFDGRWNARVKKKIRDSRVLSTRNVVEAIVKAGKRPAALVQGSAIGYYGPHGDEDLMEEAASGDDFMAEVVREWEAASEPARASGVRVTLLRTGVVLAREAGALKTLLPVFRWLPGGAAPVGSGGGALKPGSGKQWFSWIHIEDITELIVFLLDRGEAVGPVNGVAPSPVRYAEFAKSLAHVLRRPFLPIGPPDALLRLVLGEAADAITQGQRVVPARALALGFAFRHPELEPALRSLLGK